jgi:hypothetical protein
MSPFVRDVSAILLNDASAFHESWALPDSGGRKMTSLRHSVSFVQLGRELRFGAHELDAGAPAGYGRWRGRAASTRTSSRSATRLACTATSTSAVPTLRTGTVSLPTVAASSSLVWLTRATSA